MTPTQFIVDVENRLGWTPPMTRKVPLWKARSIEAMKLKRAMNEHHCTFDDLQLALSYCVARREACTPTGLCWRVQAAKEAAAEAPTDLAEAAQKAIEWEMNHDDAASDRWISRLVKSRGDVLSQVISEWQDARAVQAA